MTAPQSLLLPAQPMCRPHTASKALLYKCFTGAFTHCTALPLSRQTMRAAVAKVRNHCWAFPQGNMRQRLPAAPGQRAECPLYARVAVQVQAGEHALEASSSDYVPLRLSYVSVVNLAQHCTGAPLHVCLTTT